MKDIWFHFIVSTVPVDGLAPLGAKASVGAMMIKLMSHLYMQDQHFDGLVQDYIIYIANAL